MNFLLTKKIQTPDWLVIHNFDALKGKLVSVVIVILGVLFLGNAVGATNALDFLYYGGGIALVVIALAYFMLNHESH